MTRDKKPKGAFASFGFFAQNVFVPAPVGTSHPAHSVLLILKIARSGGGGDADRGAARRRR